MRVFHSLWLQAGKMILSVWARPVCSRVCQVAVLGFAAGVSPSVSGEGCETVRGKGHPLDSCGGSASSAPPRHGFVVTQGGCCEMLF